MLHADMNSNARRPSRVPRVGVRSSPPYDFQMQIQ
jgi:hypothetical protein